MEGWDRMQKTIQLESQRLILRTIDTSFAEKVLDYYERNADFLETWEPLKEEKFYTLGYQKDQLKNECKKLSNDNLFKVWIFKKEDTKYSRVIGSIALNEIVRGVFQSCFLGYKIDKDEVNKGYMTEALEKVIGYTFNQLRLHRIEANIMPHNKASLKVVEKLGFYNEGLAKKYLNINGKWEDHLHMVRINDSWSPRHNNV